MPLDLATAQTVNPPTVPDGKLAPLSAAGVKLTQWVLLILAAVLLILLLAITVQEWRVISVTSEAHGKALEKITALQPGSGSSPLLDAAITAAKSLQAASQDTAKASANQMIEKLDQLKTEYPERASEVNKLIADVKLIAANGKTDEAVVKALPARLEAIRASRMGTAEALELLKAQQELQKAYAESINHTREFWKSMAQMILINLLLPPLTGLLGYVFASKTNEKT